MHLKLTAFGLGLITLASITSCSDAEKSTASVFTYPETRKSDHVDTYWGVEVPDPFRWLEDDYSEETKAWVKAQNELSFGYLATLPRRADIRGRLEQIWNYERVGAPMRHGDKIYFYKNDGLQNQSVLYVKSDEDAEPEVFLDPNNLSADGTTSLAGTSFTKDGSLLVYTVSVAGSDWRDIYVMDTESKQLLDDKVLDAKFTGLAWKGKEGFYYSTYDKPDGSKLSALTNNHKLYFHALGTDQSADRLVFGDDNNPRRYVGAYVTEDEQFLIISAANSTSGNEVYVKNLKQPNAPILPIVENMNNDHTVIAHHNGHFYILTNLNAPNNRLVKTPNNRLSPSNWVDVIPETDMVLSVSTGAGKIFASYLKDAITQVVQFDMNGNQERIVELPGTGTAGGFSGKMEDKTLYYSFTSYITPGTIYEYDVASGASTLYNRPNVDFNSDLYESNQVFYTSKDGTRIPMIITHKKGLELNGKNPTILYSYGGFNISLNPTFSTANAVWLEMGGVYAVPNIRGGGEYGEKWHLSGTKMNKQNVFDDFIAAAEYLIGQGYTSSDYLAIRGGSNGGLLVGATMTQRPDLMKVAIPAVGVLDMLRYHQFTAGAGWAYDYGTADDSKEMFEYLKAYSPLHAIRDGVNYPATLVTTADHDDRVVPAHSFKFAARLQEAHRGANPVMIRIETNAGHGAGKPTAMIIDEAADIFAFILHHMGK
jgi:prolyl oligopeptidase